MFRAYFENYKTLLIEIKDLPKCEEILYLRLRILNAKMARAQRSIYRFSAIPIKFPADVFIEIDRLVLKFMRILGFQKNQKILKNKIGIILHDSNTYYIK